MQDIRDFCCVCVEPAADKQVTFLFCSGLLDDVKTRAEFEREDRCGARYCVRVHLHLNS
jgi:hypothetical protein